MGAGTAQHSAAGAVPEGDDAGIKEATGRGVPEEYAPETGVPGRVRGAVPRRQVQRLVASGHGAIATDVRDSRTARFRLTSTWLRLRVSAGGRRSIRPYKGKSPREPAARPRVVHPALGRPALPAFGHPGYPHPFLPEWCLTPSDAHCIAFELAVWPGLASNSKQSFCLGLPSTRITNTRHQCPGLPASLARSARPCQGPGLCSLGVVICSPSA